MHADGAAGGDLTDAPGLRSPSCDVLVLGVGAMGAAACRALARRGLSVVGLERHTVPNALGSSHGETRIIRKAYFEHPDYVPLLERAYALWAELEAETGQRLFERVGLLLAGPPGGEVMAGARRAGRAHGLPFEDVPARELSARFGGLRLADDQEALFEPEAGFLWVDACVRALAESARRAGARIREGVRVRAWRVDGDAVRVECDGETLSAAHLVVTAGAWAAQLLPDLGVRLEVARQPVVWLPSDEPRHALERGCPVFGFDTGRGFFYGFPSIAGGPVKLAEHGGGAAVPDASALDRALHPADAERVVAFALRHLPGIRPEIVRHSICMYTNTPDRHFVIDRHPRHARVLVAAGFSGHGFKLAPLVGELIADLATGGGRAEPIGLFSARRFGGA